MDFAPHFWKLLALRSVECMVTVPPKIECFWYEDNSVGRKRLAADCYDRVFGRSVNSDLAQAENRVEDIRIGI